MTGFDDIPQHVKENYEQLRQERDLSWEQLAADQHTGDVRLAAWMRSKAAADDPAPAGDGAPPKGRGSAKRQVTAAAKAAEGADPKPPTDPADPKPPTDPADPKPPTDPADPKPED